MIIFPRRAPKLRNGFRVILEDGTPEKILQWKSNGFKIAVDDVAASDDDDEMTREESTLGDELPAIPSKRMKTN